jgi:hypothetical protein
MNQRKRPAPSQENRPSPDATNGYTDHLSSLIGLQRHEPLTPEDREDLELLTRAAERGFKLSTTCVDCGHPITTISSIRRHRGPHCHAKAVAK